jgi:hypothetical protein
VKATKSRNTYLDRYLYIKLWGVGDAVPRPMGAGEVMLGG